MKLRENNRATAFSGWQIDSQASIKWFRENEMGEIWLENNDGRYQPEDCYVHGVVIEVSRKMR